MNILLLSTYPVEQPQHGGQHRAHQIVQAWRAAGHAVQASGVLGSGGWPATPGYAPYPAGARLTHHTGESPQLEELLIGALFADDDAHFNQLAALIDPLPDLIHVEQPWLMRFAQRWRATHHPQCRLVYGSQNVEHEMKAEIIRATRDAQQAEAARLKVARCEVGAIEAADAVVAVSAADRDWIARFTRAPIVLAPNGVPPRRATDDGIRAANRLTGQARFALFCASAHPPNMEGFFDLFGAGAAGLPPDCRLVIAGGAGPEILRDRRFAATGLAQACIAPGIVDEATLCGLLATAHASLLPITQGGGTNLKAAEALWAGKHIVTTSKALRGYESFAGHAGIHIADAPSAFQAALRRVMTAAPHTLTPQEQDARRSVLWEETLRPLLGLPAALRDNGARP